MGMKTFAIFAKIPSIAGFPSLPSRAKAMKGDRENSLDTGASDCLTKPEGSKGLAPEMISRDGDTLIYRAKQVRLQCLHAQTHLLAEHTSAEDAAQRPRFANKSPMQG